MIGIVGCLVTITSAFAVDETPRGVLSIDRSLVRVGTTPQLGWHIDYPGVTNVVEVVTPNTIEPEKTLTMRVRVLGAYFHQPKANNGGGNNLDGADYSNPGAPGEIDLSGSYDDE